MNWSAARVGLLALSVLYYVLDIGLLGWGLYLVTHPSFWGVNVGLLLLVLGLALRPRFGRVPRSSRRLSRDFAPLLFSLVKRVASDVGARAPDHIVLTLGTVVTLQNCGVRRRTTLYVGGLRWLALSPQTRVALLAHELGHTVNDDPNRSRLVQPMLTAVGSLAETTHAERTLADIVGRNRRRTNLAGRLGNAVLWVVSRPILLGQAALRAAGLGARHRAEYRADVVSASVAGTDAALAYVDRLLLARPIDRLLYNVAVHRPPHHWHVSVDTFVLAQENRLQLRGDDAIHAAELTDGHPPAGRRAQLLLAGPHREPSLIFTEAQSTAVDAQLASWLEATHDDLLGTREFIPRRRTAPRRTGLSDHLG